MRFITRVSIYNNNTGAYHAVIIIIIIIIIIIVLIHPRAVFNVPGRNNVVTRNIRPFTRNACARGLHGLFAQGYRP